MKQIVYVVLVDGKTTRVLPEERDVAQGPSAVDRVGKLVEDHATTVVAEKAAHEAICAAIPMANVLLAANPAIGMVAQLALASRTIDPEASLAVLPAERSGVRKDTVDNCERAFAASDQDVAFPSAGGQPGYPVYLSPEARTKLDGMPDGDLLSAVRSDPSLSKLAVECRDVGIYLDRRDSEQRDDLQRQLAVQQTFGRELSDS